MKQFKDLGRALTLWRELVENHERHERLITELLDAVETGAPHLMLPGARPDTVSRARDGIFKANQTPKEHDMTDTPQDERSLATDAQLDEARALYNDGDIAFDGDARVSVAEGGVWVQAWVWVPDNDIATDEERSNGPRR